ncbi:MAG: hypothetical protein PHG73_02075 [Pygmaiobacter sp.]|nr:hypothetical protein [Pygmaiobacter sp.]
MVEVGEKSSFVKRTYIIDILFLLILIVFCYIYTFHTKELVEIDGDFGNGYWAVIAGNAKTLMNGEYPLWTPYLWGGYTNAGSIFGCFYPIFIPLYFIFWNSETQCLSFLFFTAVLFIHLSIFSIGTYFLGKKVTHSRLVSWVCASLATFCGCTLHGYHWAYIFIGFSWIPVFVFAYSNVLDLAEKGKLWTLLSASIIALVGLGSTSHGLLFLAGCMFFVFISYVVSDYKNFFKYLKKSILIGLLGISMCAIQIIPFIQNMRLAHRFVNSPNGILDYAEYVRNVVPVSYLHQLLGQHTGWYAMSLLLFLAIVYAYKLKTKKDKQLIVFAKIFLIFTFCMVSGAFLPDLMWHVFGFNQIRQQSLWLPCISIAGSILAGYVISCFYSCKLDLKEYKINAVDVVILILVFGKMKVSQKVSKKLAPQMA